METIQEDGSYEETWLGTQEDQLDFEQLCDEFLYSQRKKSKQSDDEEGRGIQVDDKNLNNTGGSSLASWLGDEEDKVDFVQLSDKFLTSSMKKQVRVGVEECSSNLDRKTSLDTTGGSSMAS